MGDAPVEQVGPADAVAQRRDAGPDLRDHALGQRSVRQHGGQVRGGDLGDQGVLVVEVAVEARDVGEVDELLRPKGLGDGPGHGVGVDVVGLALLVDADGGDDRDELLGDLAFEDVRVDPADVADEAEAGVPLADGDEAGVLPRQADGVGAVAVDGADDLAVDLAQQGHADDVDGLRVGDPQTLDEDRFLAEAAHQVGDLWPAAVDDDGIHADEAHQHDVLGEQLEVAHGVAAVLDHDGLAGELPDVGQRLGQDRRLALRPDVEHCFDDREAHDVLMFSSM